MKPRRTWLQLLLVLISIRGCLCQEKTINRLRDYVFKDYSNEVRPVYNTSDVTTVIVRFSIRNLLKMDTREQFFTIATYLKLTWTDEFIRWNPADFDGTERLHVPVSKIWKPDITLADNADLNFERYKPDTVVQLYPDGKVTWYTPAIFTSTCRAQVKWFPFDVQVCEMVLQSWAYNGFEIDLYPEESLDASTRRYVANGVWDMCDTYAKRIKVVYTCCPEPYPELHYILVFRRHALFYIFYMILPCLFLSVLSLLVFYLPPDCGEKLTLSITNLLALVVFQQLIAENMPPTSDDPPIIGIYFLCMIVMVCVSVVATGFVMHLSAISQPMPPWVKYVFLKLIPAILCLSSPIVADEHIDYESTVHNQHATELETIENNGFTKDFNNEAETDSLKNVADILRFLKQDTTAKNAEALEHLQWRRVSIVVDRLLLAIFAVFIIVCTTYLTIQIITGSEEEFDEIKRTLEVDC